MSEDQTPERNSPDSPDSPDSTVETAEMSIPLYPGINLQSWSEMTNRVRQQIKGNCTLVPIFDDPLNVMIQTFGFSIDILEETFFPVRARIGPNNRNQPYCVIQHFFNEDGNLNRRDSSHKIIPHKTANIPVVVMIGNEIRDGKVCKNCNNPESDAYIMAYHIMMDNDLAQRAMNLLYPLQVTDQVFFQFMMNGQNMNDVPNYVMGMTGVNIQQEVIDLLDDIDHP